MRDNTITKGTQKGIEWVDKFGVFVPLLFLFYAID